jgi:hypothetical protein
MLGAASCTSSGDPALAKVERIEELQRLERERLRSLVSADIATARRLHADDFQLINPLGEAFSKQEYLGQIESGQLNYQGWDAAEIVVRLYRDAAVIRYQDIRFDVDWEGQPVHRGPMYHTNVYERRGEQWQVVWSQASGAITP